MKKCTHTWEIIDEIDLKVPLKEPRWEEPCVYIQEYEPLFFGLFGGKEIPLKKVLVTHEWIDGFKVKCKKCWKVKTIKEGELP